MIQESYDLPAGAYVVRAEHTISGSGGDTLLDSPLYRFRVVSACRNIRKGTRAAKRLRGTRNAPQEDCHLGAGTGIVQSEYTIPSSSGNPLFNGPLDRLCSETVSLSST